MMVGDQRHVPAAFSSGLTRYLFNKKKVVEPRAGVGGCGIFRSQRDSIPGPSESSYDC